MLAEATVLEPLSSIQIQVSYDHPLSGKKANINTSLNSQYTMNIDPRSYSTQTCKQEYFSQEGWSEITKHNT